jgi:hypothetical protein
MTQLVLKLDDVEPCPTCKRDAPVIDIHNMGECYPCFLVQVGAVQPESEHV